MCHTYLRGLRTSDFSNPRTFNEFDIRIWGANGKMIFYFSLSYVDYVLISLMSNTNLTMDFGLLKNRKHNAVGGIHSILIWSTQSRLKASYLFSFEIL